MKNKIRHPGQVIWEDYFKEDLSTLSRFLGHYNGANVLLNFLNILSGECKSLEGFRYKLSEFFKVPTHTIFKIQEEYDLYLLFSTNEYLVYEELAREFKSMTGVDRQPNNFKAALEHNDPTEIVFSTETRLLVEKILNKSLLEWVRVEIKNIRRGKINNF